MVSLSPFILPLHTHLLLRKCYLVQKRAHFTMLIASYFKRSHIVWPIFIVKLESLTLFLFLQEREIHASEAVISYWSKRTLFLEVLAFTFEQF